MSMCKKCVEWERLYRILQRESERNKEVARELSIKLADRDEELSDLQFTLDQLPAHNWYRKYVNLKQGKEDV